MGKRASWAPAVLAALMALGTGCQPPTIPDLPLASATSTAEQMPRITAADLKARLDRGEPFVIADTRAPSLFAAKRIKGAVNIPYGVEGQDFSQLPKDRFIALYCT